MLALFTEDVELKRNHRLNEQAAISNKQHRIIMPFASKTLAKCKFGVKRSKRFIDRTGHRVGKLTAIRLFDIKNGEARWQCKCECGNEVIVYFRNTKSCGCLIVETLIKNSLRHGFARGKKRMAEYRVWGHMKERCYNPNAAHYDLYGGRGIKVCDRWLNSFPNFFEDMGKRPNGMTIERKDSNGNYSPENCCWATNDEQQNNKRNNVFLEYDGKKLSCAQWARELGCDKSTVCARVKSGWSIEKICTTPPDAKKQRFK